MKVLISKKCQESFRKFNVQTLDKVFEYLFSIRNESVSKFLERKDVKILDHKENIILISIDQNIRAFSTLVKENDNEQLILLQLSDRKNIFEELKKAE
jgi:hypothetical protein